MPWNVFVNLNQSCHVIAGPDNVLRHVTAVPHWQLFFSDMFFSATAAFMSREVGEKDASVLVSSNHPQSKVRMRRRRTVLPSSSHPLIQLFIFNPGLTREHTVNTQFISACFHRQRHRVTLLQLNNQLLTYHSELLKVVLLRICCLAIDDCKKSAVLCIVRKNNQDTKRLCMFSASSICRIRCNPLVLLKVVSISSMCILTSISSTSKSDTNSEASKNLRGF